MSEPLNLRLSFRDAPALYAWPQKWIDMLTSEPAWGADAIHWWTYRGTISPEHIKAIQKRP